MTTEPKPGWSRTDGSLYEYQKIKYFGLFGMWIGVGVVWAVNSHGQVTTSPWDVSVYGIKSLKFWYFRITVRPPRPS